MTVAIDLRDRVAVVSGATSGIGAEAARRLAAAGASIVVVGRSDVRAEAVRGQIAAAGGVASVALADIAESNAVDGVIEHTLTRHGRLDIVVNAAGVIVRADALTTTDADWATVMRTNVDGTFFLSRAAIGPMRATGGGSIVNVSSTCGVTGSAGLAAYCASKGAVTNLTRAMALDHIGDGIRINAVCPGAVDTPMLYSEHAAAVDLDDVRTQNVAAIPQGRMATDRDVADVIVFLASDLSGHVVGANVTVDGGYTAR